MTNDTLPLMRRRLLMLDLGLLVVALSWGASYCQRQDF